MHLSRQVQIPEEAEESAVSDLKSLSLKTVRLIAYALDDAKRDRQAFVEAWTPRYGKPGIEAKKIIRTTNRTIDKYTGLERECWQEIGRRTRRLA